MLFSQSELLTPSPPHPIPKYGTYLSLAHTQKIAVSA
jgi:hypothetical protein